MSCWTIHDRARNIGTKRRPHFVTIWTGRDDDGYRHWMVNNKPDTENADGPIYAAQGGPSSLSEKRTLAEAIAEYKQDFTEIVALGV